jgi:hypothetical protein
LLIVLFLNSTPLSGIIQLGIPPGRPLCGLFNISLKVARVLEALTGNILRYHPTIQRVKISIAR